MIWQYHNNIKGPNMAWVSNFSFHHTVIYCSYYNIANYDQTAYCDTIGSHMHLLIILRSVLDEHSSTKYQISVQKKVCRIKGMVSSLLNLMSKKKRWLYVLSAIIWHTSLNSAIWPTLVKSLQRHQQLHFLFNEVLPCMQAL